MISAEFRKLPALDALLREPAIALLAAEYGPATVAATLRALLAAARHRVSVGEAAPAPASWSACLAEQLATEQQPSLRPLINATGVILHTNLGRAPLSQGAIAAMQQVAAAYNNLEYDLVAGERGSRHDHPRALLSKLTGAEDALVVNNNAAAIYLVLAALCQGREVLISRSQLVEIGGGFRIPDVLRQSGAKLVEVGATNRTHLRDFSEAITSNTAAILRVHSSNFRQIGFVTMPSLAELAELVRSHNQKTGPKTGDDLVLIDDLGSGTLLPTTPYGLLAEPTVQQSVVAGVDVVAFSGDKLLGGPQAGLLIGRRVLIERIRRHPLARALRVDKLTLAALDATLRSYQRGRAVQEIPVWQMISAPLPQLSAQVQQWQASLAAAGLNSLARPGESAIGGGSLPGETLPTTLLALAHSQPDATAARLRSLPTPIICRIQHAELLFDPRTVLPGQAEPLLQGILQICSAS